MSRTRQLIIYASLILASGFFWVVLILSGLLEGVEQEALNWRYQARGEVHAGESPVMFVNIDPQTLAVIGDRPWDRLNFAQTLAALLGPGQARAIGVDVIFSPLGTGSLLDVERARSGDFRLGEVVAQYSDRLVLAAAYLPLDIIGWELPLRRKGYLEPDEVPFPESPTFPIVKFDTLRLGIVNLDDELNRGAIPHKLPAIFETEGEFFSRHLINGQRRYFNHVLNQPEVLERDGFFQVVDADGFALEAIPKRSSHRFLTLGIEVFLAANGLDASDVEWTEDALIVRKEGEVFCEIPLIQGQSIKVNWLRGWDRGFSASHNSMADVLERAHALGEAYGRGDSAAVREQEQWFERFRDKVIFIGGTDATLSDLAPTPYNREPVPKVRLHANVFRMVQELAFTTELGKGALCLITLLLSAIVATMLLGSGRWKNLLRAGAIFLLVGYVALVFVSFSRCGLILPLIAPMGASVTAALFVVVCKLGSEEYQRRRIKTLFGSYVSPSLVDQMVESARDPELGGVEVQVTALFSDVEGFSALSEELSPHDLVSLMNEYLGAMTETFQEEQGTLDKYIGDAIVTMFGMPYPVEDHAARACRSAVRMQERHAGLRERWAKEGRWPEKVLKMRTRIGINTGDAVIGNMGSEMRFNYTMMGDSVNLAARCESGAKSYGVYTMITADTLEAALQAGEKLEYRKLDRIVVKGRSQPVEIFELWDGTADPHQVEACKQAYDRALELYFAGEWEAALQGFEACVAHEPSRRFAPTTPSEVLAARCREYLERGSPEGWDGVYRMTSK